MHTKSSFDAQESRVPNEILAAMISVTINRAPADTVVFIDGVQLPQAVSSMRLPPGTHTLRTRIDGDAGDTGTGKVLLGDQVLCEETARIPAGFSRAYSAEGRFNV